MKLNSSLIRSSTSVLMSTALLCSFAPQASARRQSVSPPSAQAGGKAIELASGKSIIVEVAGSETRSYAVSLRADQFAWITVEQRGVDVGLSLTAPNGAKLAEVDSPNGKVGPESIAWLSEAGGEYKLEVTSPANARGRYEIKIIELRGATARDKNHVAAIEAFMEAELLYKQDAADAKQKAVGKYKEAIALFRDSGDRYHEALALYVLGVAYRVRSEPKVSLGYLEQALSAWRRIGRTYDQAKALKDIARVYHSLGEYQKTLDYLDQSRAVWKTLDEKLEAAYVLIDSGVVYSSLGDYPGALRSFNAALPPLRADGDRRREATTLNNIGFVYNSIGESQKSLDTYEQVLPLRRALKDTTGEATTLNNIGWARSSLGENHKAIETLNQALTLWRKTGVRSGEAYALAGLGNAYQGQGKYKEAVTYFSEAMGVYKEITKPEGEALALHNLMLVWKSLKNPRLAVMYGKQAVNVYQQLRNNIKGIDKATQSTFLKSKEKTYRTLADTLIAEGRLPEAQQVLKMLKEEEYFDYIQRDGGDSSTLSGRSELSPKEAESAKKYDEAIGQIVVRGKQRNELLAKEQRSAEDNKLLSTIEVELNVAGQSFQQFLDRLEVEFGDTKQAAKVEQLRESQGLMEDLREMGGDAVALYTVVGEEKYRVIMVTPEVQLAREFPIKAEELNKKVAAFRDALQNPAQDSLPLAKELYKILVGPIAKDLKDAGAQTLMYSLDGVLRYLPVSALHDGEKFLVESYRVVVFTPASMARLKDQPTAKWKAVGLGVSRAHEGFSALPGVSKELNGIISNDAAKTDVVLTGKVLMDEAFTEETMREELRQRYPVVHIASHFSFRPGNETQSFLLLGDGNRLSLAKVKAAQNLFGGVEMLTLSACDTASGGAGADGKEVEGFAVLAQRQGAKAVVATLWPVADASTQRLMQNFYRLRESGGGMSKVEALRQAQVALISGNRYSHPYFWAPFIMIGNWK